MKKVIVVGKIDNNTEIKVTDKNLEIIEYTIDDLKVKSFGKVAQVAKSLSGIVVADGTIQNRDYTNKEGKTYKIQEVLINKINGLEEQPKDNFDVKPSDFDSGKTKLPSAQQMQFEEEDYPFY